MINRALLAGLVALVAALAVSVAPAFAEPLLAIESPSSGSVTNNTHPTVSGNSSDGEDAVTVIVLKEGSFYESALAEPKPSGAWSVVLPTQLKDGEYTVVAEQTETLTGEPGKSPAVSFTVDTQSPNVTLNAISSPTKDSTPSFSGTASDTTDVTVYVFKGSSTGGTLADTTTAGGTGGGWSSGSVGPLDDGTYTAIAEQTSSLGNKPGSSGPMTFVIHASQPKVTLNGISSPTSDRTPSFSGTASEKSPVTVKVFAGATAKGGPVAEAEASGTGGSWSSGSVSSALADGTYTAVAEQESEFGNGPGTSGEIHFSVETPRPSVSLEAVPTPSNDTTPAFSGFASEKTGVTIHIYAGGSGGGEEKASAHANGTGGSWSSGSASPPLGEGSYTAVAEQVGAFGNGTGHSSEIHFSVITASPHVTLDPIKTPSGNRSPSFTGTASENTTVSVLIFPGNTASGKSVASASASGTGGSFSSGHVSPELADGTYTAVAVQSSSLGNPPGQSSEVTFTVDSSSPTVTLNPITTPSNNAQPSFAGTATDSTSVVVHIFHEGEQVASASGNPSSGSWKTGVPTKALSSGSYTAQAEQPSSLGNAPGKSGIISFVVNTASPQVKLNQPAARSGDTTPSFSGTASDATPVTVEIFKAGSLVRTVEAGPPGIGAAWTSPAVSPALGSGTYTAIATQASSLGNAPGHSETRTFEIDTNAPTVTVTQPLTPSNIRTPTFSGTASESSPVHVHVLESGTQIRELTATPSGGTWSTEALASALATGRHTYVVFATQESTIGNKPGKSEELPFVVDTTSPVVTLEKVTTPSNVKAPTFRGSAGDTTAVTVEIHAGTSVAGALAGTASQTTREGNQWTAASPALADGTYTAVAVEKSSLGNEDGRSGPVTFTIDTSAPKVSLDAFKSPSNGRAPSFSGGASGTEPVVVQILEGGHQVASAQGTPSAGRWKAGPVKPELPAGEHAYTVLATQKSSLLGNPEGRSEELPLVIDTLPPAVTLEGVAESSNNTEPTFNGTATDIGPVTVKVKGGGKEFKATGTVSAGTWSTTPGSIVLPVAKFAITYTVFAEQASSLGNETGRTKTFTFVVDPSAPTVSMTPVKSQIGTSTPTFTGTASDASEVFVAICRIGPLPCAAEHGEEEARSHGGGSWSATEGTPLEDGEYEAIAWQKTAGGALGTTPRQIFTVDTVPPAVSIVAPSEGATVSGSVVALHGAAGTELHDVQSVTLQLFAGSTAAGSALQTVTVPASGTGWSAELGGLTPGQYTVRATQGDEAGNVGVSLHSFTDTATAASSAGPTAAFTWFPAHPHTREPVTLVSTSSDSTSPITSYAWNLLGSTFAAGAQRQTTTFTSRGKHLVRLRVTDGAGRSSVASEQIPVSFPLMRPFPSVRIVTTRSRGRLRLKALTVEAPAGATVTASCKGKGCPVRSLTRVVARPKGKPGSGLVALALPRLQRVFPAGTALEIRITQAGRIGKFTRFAIRKGKLPLRADACVSSTEPKPVPCAG